MCPRSRAQRQPGSPWLYPRLLLLGLLAPGCSEELGPERFPTTRVAGIVVEGGRPVAGGWIEVIPTDGTVGNIRSARIGTDGSSSSKVAPAPMPVTAVGPDGSSPCLPSRCWRRDSSRTILGRSRQPSGWRIASFLLREVLTRDHGQRESRAAGKDVV